MAAPQLYVSIPVAHRGAERFPELVPLTRNGELVKVGDILTGQARVDDEDEPFDQLPQEKFSYLVSLGDTEVFRHTAKQLRHMSMKNGEKRPMSRGRVAIKAAQTFVKVVEEAGIIRIAFGGSRISIGQGALSPRDLYLEGLRLNENRTTSYALQLAIPTPPPVVPPSAPSTTLGAQVVQNPAVFVDQSLLSHVNVIPPLNGMPTTAAAAATSFGSTSGASTSSGGCTRPPTQRMRTHPYALVSSRPMIGRQAIMRGRRGFSTSSLQSLTVMGDPQSSSSMDSSHSRLPCSPNAAAGPSTMPLGTYSSSPSRSNGLLEAHGRYSPDVYYPSVVANASDGLGVQEPAFAVPSLSTSPEPMESPTWEQFSDGSVASSPQSTLFSADYPTYSPASSPSLEPNYAYSPVSDPIYPPGSAATIPRSMAYPAYRGHSADGLSYWNMDSNYGFQG